MLVVLYPLIVLVLFVVWFVVARVFKKASLASLLVTVLFPIVGADRRATTSGRSRCSPRSRCSSSCATRRTSAACVRHEEIDLAGPEARLHQVRKAVIPAAGLGTRFLPATKSVPKEMLPVIDRPAIEYVVEEAVGAGLTDILIVTGRNKRAVEEHFDRNVELELALERDGKDDLLKAVQYSNDLADVHYVRQREALGLGHAVSVARHHVGDEPFAVLLPDDLMIDDSRAAARDGRGVRAARQRGDRAAGGARRRRSRRTAAAIRSASRSTVSSSCAASSRSRSARKRRRTSR